MRKIVVCMCTLLLSAPVYAQAPQRVPSQPVSQGTQVPGSGGHEWTFAEVLTSALAQHPLVEAARARADAARGNRMTAAAFPNPVASYWSENSRLPFAHSLSGVDLETSAYLTVPLEPFFQRSPRVRAANEAVNDAEAAIATARRDVALAAARAFFQVALLQGTVEAARANRTALESLASFSQSRVTEGAMAEVDLMRVQVEVARADADIALAEADLARASAELRLFLPAGSAQGRAADPVRVTAPSGPGPASSLAPVDEFLARASASRPELLSARARFASTAATVAYERTLGVRQLGATFGFKRSAGQTSLVAGAALTLPLFERNQGGIARATADSREAEQQLAWWQRTIESEVHGAYAAAERLTRQIAAMQPLFLQRAESVDRITLAAYLEGGATLMQVLDASRTLTDVRLTYARTLFAERERRFELALAAGAEPDAALLTLDHGGLK